ncbi:MAG TPA: O-antigen ligase family protein [Coriobacteriaceae bacterium]|nr:O-antigen ligase family protein [Coriobacteriaceae bacterium]
MLDKQIYRLNASVIYSMLLYPLCVTVRKVSIFDFVGKAVLVVMLFSLLILFCIKRQDKSSWLILALTAAMHIFEFAYPVSQKETFTTYLMYAVWVIFFLYLQNNYGSFFDAANKQQAAINSTVIIWEIIVIVSAFFPSSYEHTWGEGSYFISFSNTSFELAPAASLVFAFVIFCYACDGNARKAVLLSAVPVVCSFASGSRTYLVVIALEVLILAMMIIKSKLALIAFIVIALIAGIGLLSMTNIWTKFANAFQYSNNSSSFWSVFTSGRDAFWRADMDAFGKGGMVNQLFGYGFSYVYEVNESVFGNRIYAHNDFINILLTFGWAGLIPYFFAFGKCVLMLGRQMERGFLFSILAIWLFNAVFNMTYVYMNATFGLGLLMISAVKYCQDLKGALSNTTDS